MKFRRAFPSLLLGIRTVPSELRVQNLKYLFGVPTVLDRTRTEFTDDAFRGQGAQEIRCARLTYVQVRLHGAYGHDRLREEQIGNLNCPTPSSLQRKPIAGHRLIRLDPSQALQILLGPRRELITKCP